MPRSARLRRRVEFQRVYREGRRVAARHMVVFALHRTGDDAGCRFGVTASRRVGPAVVRNRCKRRLRELFRLHREELGDLTVDLVINARRGCDRAGWPELRRQYLGCMATIQRWLRAG